MEEGKSGHEGARTHRRIRVVHRAKSWAQLTLGCDELGNQELISFSNGLYHREEHVGVSVPGPLDSHKIS
jgi:hypothetical protein